MDQKLFSLINQQWIGPVPDRIMALLSSLEAWILPIAILVFFLLWLGGFRARTLVFCAVAVVAINDGIVSNALKHLVNRPRPIQSENHVRHVKLVAASPRLLAILQPAEVEFTHPRPDYETAGGHSFPSSHTINMVSVALLVACSYRRWGWLAFIPALGVGYSRIYTGVHWPTDVFASIFLGLGLTLMLLAAFEWLWTKAGRRWWPEFLEEHPRLIPA